MTNSRLVFQPGNQWDGAVSPFFVVPSWWRRFIYQTLSPREFVVYAYICGVFDKHAIAYPTIDQIADDLGVNSRVIVSRAVEKLVRFGFVMRGPALIRGRLLSRRPVYQRPLAAFTILRLLEIGEINEQLFPRKTGSRDEDDSSQGAIKLGLRTILGADLFQAYSIATTDAKRPILIAGLQHIVNDARNVAQAKLSRSPRSLPDGVSALLAEDQGVPF